MFEIKNSIEQSGGLSRTKATRNEIRVWHERKVRDKDERHIFPGEEFLHLHG